MITVLHMPKWHLEGWIRFELLAYVGQWTTLDALLAGMVPVAFEGRAVA